MNPTTGLRDRSSLGVTKRVRSTLGYSSCEASSLSHLHRRSRAHTRLTVRRRSPLLSAAVVVASVLAVGMPRAGAVGAQPDTACPDSPTTLPTPGGGSLTILCKWKVFLNGHVDQSSPEIATLDAHGPSILVGTRDTGLVYALNLSSGQTVSGWPVATGSAVDSSPTAVPAAGGRDNVVVDSGDVVTLPPRSLDTDHGAVQEIAPGGQTLWKRGISDQFDPTFGTNPAVYASPVVADTTGSGTPSIVTAGVSLSQYTLSAGSGATETGWPRKTADSTFSTAAVADLFGGRDPVIVAGSDSSAGPGALNNWNGGVVRAETGAGQVLWSYRTNEVVTSSPAVGNLAGTGEKVVFGHGRYWSDREFAPDATKVTALNSNGTLAWQSTLGGYTPASPALADLTGNGQLDVVEPTWTAYGSRTGGSVYAIQPNGHPLWGPAGLWTGNSTANSAEVIYGGVATADFGEHYQDVVAASGTGWNILDGRTGSSILPYGPLSGVNVDWDGHQADLAMQNTPLVTPDPSGHGLDIVLAGTYAGVGDNRGFVAVYQVTSAPSSVGARAWPMFHHDQQHTGSTSPPALSCRGCVPADSSSGYWLSGADGGVFAYGAPYAGSMGGRRLHAPIVGMASTPDGRGYWLVASDGGIFAFGDAAFHGSMGGRVLARPVVGMAPTPDGGGYWLVASDGGIFAFGDAGFYGSMGGRVLARPVVGMAAGPDDHGYWLVASDGGVFSFGDVVFHGSMGGRHLAAPVVSIETIPGAGGYWEIASDGGIFAFEAPFFGSMGGRRLVASVVDAAVPAPQLGGGYWEAARDGGVFAFGLAPFHGSAGGLRLSAPVVAMSEAG